MLRLKKLRHALNQALTYKERRQLIYAFQQDVNHHQGFYVHSSCKHSFWKPETKIRLLQGFLMTIVIARPSSLSKLDGREKY